MIKKISASLILTMVAIVALIFPSKLEISAATSSYNVYVDYNATKISKYLLPAETNRLQNFTQQVEDGEGIRIPTFSETLNCYYRCKWTINGNVVDLNTYEVHNNLTVVANWTPVEYEIRYNYLNGEEDEITNLQSLVKYTIEDGKIVFYRPERPGYVFVDWYSSTKLTDQFLLLFKDTYTIGTINIYAKWRPIEYKINYNTDANNVYNPPTYNVENKGFDLVAASKEGHIFEGWYLDKEFTNKCLRIDNSFSGDINLYPKFTPKVYKVTYILPSGQKAFVNVAYGQTASLPELNKNIFQIVKTDVSRKNITGDTTINIRYVNIWYVYLLCFLVVSGIIVLICYLVIKRRKNLHRLRYVYNSPNKKNRRWK